MPSRVGNSEFASTPQRSRGGDAGGGVDVAFSDDRFLRRVLAEANRGGANDAGSAARLEGHGFAPDVARIALHVSGGDERRALELCMSGLSFTGAGGMNGDLLSPEKVCPPPAPLACYICGGKHLTEKSLEFHVKACRRRFSQREAKREPHLRRSLLEEHELPDGVSNLEQYYELAGRKPPPERAEEDFGSSGATAKQSTIEDMVSRQRQENSLLPCQYCKRTFARDRLGVHQRVCLQRPKHIEDYSPKFVARPAPPAQRKSTGSVTSAGEKAYEAFCQNLTRCPGCSRQFKKELLDGHVKQCPAALRAAQGRETQAAPSRPSRQAPRSKSTSASTSGFGSQKSTSSFAPPPRAAPGSRTPPCPPPPGRRPSAAAAAATAPPSNGVEESLRSAEALIAKGFVSPANADDEASLHAQLLGSLPSAEFVGAYKVTASSQNRIYEALRDSLQEQGGFGGVAPHEVNLWHGTSWAILAKILRHGYNRSFAGRHGTLLGMATYFSAKLSYSARFCDKHGGGADSTKVVLLSQVLVGKYCKGSASDVEPPLLDEETGERYDSTVDNEENPSIFAVFRDFQALPLYLVEFRT